MAQHDLGVTSLEEFGRLTPSMFQALQERKHIHFKYESYWAGIPASTIINIKLPKNAEPVSPFDFAGIEHSTEMSEYEKLRHNITAMFSSLSLTSDSSPQRYKALQERTIERLLADGHPDAEEVFDEIFPGWREERTKCQQS